LKQILPQYILIMFWNVDNLAMFRNRYNPLIFFLLILISQPLFSQSADSSDFMPYGSPIMRIYSNFHTGFTGSELKSGIEV